MTLKGQEIKEIFIPSQQFCRCCHETRNLRSLSELDHSRDNNKTFSEILQETFSIYLKAIETISATDSEWICNSCVSSLLDASAFKNQVLQCEKRLIAANIKTEYPSTSHQIKNENPNQIKKEHLESDNNPVIELVDAPQTLDSPDHHHTTKDKKRKKRPVEEQPVSDDDDWDSQEQDKPTQENKSRPNYLLTHSGERPYICDVCGRRFPQRTHLKRHIHIIHTGVKPCKCQICQKQFSSKSYLSVHERQHTGVTPYSCEYCKKPFDAYTSLKVHLLVHTAAHLRQNLRPNVQFSHS